jgi:hypothetical protein
MADTPPQLTINPDDAFYILVKAREFDEKVDESDPDSGSDPADDNMVDILEDRASDPTHAELVAAINGLNDDAQLDLIALIWLGRGDFTLGEWDEARQSARDIGRPRMARYVCGIPLVSDYLDDALAQFGLSFEDYMERV